LLESIVPRPTTHGESGSQCLILGILGMSPRLQLYILTFDLLTQTHTFRKQEACQPAFPMNICSRTFELVSDHLQTLNYDGPVGLSCDDTKLFATYRLYWDSKEKAYFLVGGVDGPIRVADPDDIKQVIQDAKAQNATKVSSIITFPDLSLIVSLGSPLVSDNTSAKSCTNHRCSSSYTQFIERTNTP